jgi:hypothetical protein
MTDLRLPVISASPWRLRRSGLNWLHRSGDAVAAREPVAACHVRLAESGRHDRPLPLGEEQNDLQVVLAPSHACTVTYAKESAAAGYQALVEGGDWHSGECIGHADLSPGAGVLVPLVLAGRRGFENGEGRGDLLAGWHEKVRGFWEGDGEAEGRYGTVLALGTCEQTAIFRGDDAAFFSWFARTPGPAQLIAVADERCVHSSAVLLQHVRRTPAEAIAITEAVHAWIGERIGRADPASFPAFHPDAARGTLQGRWPHAQDVLFALHLLAEAVGTSPILERSEVIGRRGILELNPPDAVALTLGSELALHYRHRRTGWIIAMHGFRFGPYLGPGVVDWLRRDFEPLIRSVADTRRDLAALADEVRSRTGARLLVQNLIASDVADRIANYSWLGDAFEQSLAVLGNEANLMLTDLTREHSIAMIDADALAAQLGVRHCPDRFHASRELVEAQRNEVHRILRDCQIPGF